ncbi:MAG TPA: alkaline phosphatase [Bacteroidales bacterium]|nr:alkaline phosphatase [Bacteroidales bacterium]
MKKQPIQIVIILMIFLFIGCSWKNINETKNPVKKPKNIILFIGDGMGIAQLNAGMDVIDRPLFLESFPYSGFSKTYSFDNYVTDSGAGGTAIACGIKTRNGMIGTAPDSTAVTSIIEIAHKNGLATGVMSTSAITHATPASFVAHNADRGNYEDIAKDFLNGTLDLFIGGGEDHFRKRADSADLVVKLREQGFDIVSTIDALKLSKSAKIAGLLAKEHMPSVLDGRQGMLEEMTKKALETLSRDKDGFFLMIEGSMIDWGAHARNLLYVAAEVIDMDNAIGVALEFADLNGETLIVVTADHETGGLTLVGGNKKERSIEGNFIPTGNHTGVMVPIFSYGPGAERFSGIHENTFFLQEFLDLLNIKK